MVETLVLKHGSLETSGNETFGCASSGVGSEDRELRGHAPSSPRQRAPKEAIATL